MLETFAKQDQVYKLKGEYYLRLNNESVGFKVSSKIAIKMAFLLNATRKYYSSESKTTSQEHIKKVADSNHCVDAGLKLFDVEISEDAHEEECENKVFENSSQILNETFVSSKAELLLLLSSKQELAPFWIVVHGQFDDGRPYIHHLSTFFGFDELNRVVIFDKANSGIGNPWEVIDMQDYFPRCEGMKISFRKPIEK